MGVVLWVTCYGNNRKLKKKKEKKSKKFETDCCVL